MKELLPQSPGRNPKPAPPSPQASKAGKMGTADPGHSCAWRGLPLRPPWSLAGGTRGIRREPSWWPALSAVERPADV